MANLPGGKRLRQCLEIELGIGPRLRGAADIDDKIEAVGDAAKAILAAWPTKLPKFVRVIPKDYKRVLACLKRAHDQGLSGDEAIMAAFEENARDLSRVGGN